MGGLGSIGNIGHIRIGGTLGDWGNQMKRMAEDPKKYMEDLGEKFKALPAEFDQARIAVMTGLAPNALVKLYEKMTESSNKISIGMQYEEQLRIFIHDTTIEYRTVSGGTNPESCPTLVSSFVMTKLAGGLPPDDPFLAYVKDNAKRIAQDECSKNYVQ